MTLTSIVEDKNVWSYTSTPLYVFMTCVTYNRNLQETKNVVGRKRVEVAWVMCKHVYTLKIAAVCCCETVVRPSRPTAWSRALSERSVLPEVVEEVPAFC